MVLCLIPTVSDIAEMCERTYSRCFCTDRDTDWARQACNYRLTRGVLDDLEESRGVRTSHSPSHAQLQPGTARDQPAGSPTQQVCETVWLPAQCMAAS